MSYDKITIIKNEDIEAQKYNALCELIIHEERDDTTTFLKKFESGEIKNEGVYSRIIKHLEIEGIIKDNTITVYGRDCMKSNKYEMKERGQYIIIYDEEEKCIIKMERKEEEDKRTGLTESYYFNESNNKDNINLISNETEKKAELEKLYNLTSNEQSNWHRDKKIQKSKITNTYSKEKEEIVIVYGYDYNRFKKDVKNICDTFPNSVFDEEGGILKVNFSSIDENEKIKYERNNNDIKGLTLRPIDKASADNWYYYLINKNIVEYTMPRDFYIKREEILSESVFDNIKPSDFDIDNFLRNNNDKNIYWYFNAANDLIKDYMDAPKLIEDSKKIFKAKL